MVNKPNTTPVKTSEDVPLEVPAFVLSVLSEEPVRLIAVPQIALAPSAPAAAEPPAWSASAEGTVVPLPSTIAEDPSVAIAAVASAIAINPPATPAAEYSTSEYKSVST